MMRMPRRTELARDVIEDGVIDPKESYISRDFTSDKYDNPICKRYLNPRLFKTRRTLGSCYVYLYGCNHIRETIIYEAPSYRGFEGYQVK